MLVQLLETPAKLEQMSTNTMAAHLPLICQYLPPPLKRINTQIRALLRHFITSESLFNLCNLKVCDSQQSVRVFGSPVLKVTIRRPLKCTL